MRRTARALGIGIAAAALLGVAGCSADEPSADPQDFSYDSWHVSYEIGVDDEGRAVAEVTETMVARFPDFDQNRGIVRGIPIDYQGASTDPRDFTVTDEHGEPLPFEIEEDDDFIAVIVGDEYVHGRQGYVIGYTLSDPILAREDGLADEFYWDLIDFEHLQPVDAFSAEFVFAEGLADRLDGNARCYSGEAYSEAECRLEGADGAFELAPLPIAPREGVTVAIGLEPGSVAQPPARVPNFALDVLPVAAGGAGLLAALGGIAATVASRLRRRRAPGAIIAEYEVPDELPPLVAAELVGASSRAIPAQVVHLAVRGALRIEEDESTEGKSRRKKEDPALRLLDPSRVGDPLDARSLDELFGSKAAAGAVIRLPKRDQEFGQRMRRLGAKGREEAIARGYLEKRRSRLGLALALLALALTAVLAVLLVLAIASGRTSPLPYVGMILGIVALLIALGLLSKQRMHTPEGARARARLLGVKEFIRVAEADRLRALQSYSGAERAPDGGIEGGVDVIRVYERLLPYAMLFGLEKEWSRVLEVRYEEAGAVPLWYPTLALHGLGGLSGTLTHFTGSLNSAVAYSSSGAGGSTGGGFAGGGGGGGFSGGH